MGAMSRQLITVNRLTPPSELAVLAINAAVALDVTSLDLGRLPQHVKAALYTEATTFSAPQLQTSGYIDAPEAPPRSTTTARRASTALDF